MNNYCDFVRNSLFSVISEMKEQLNSFVKRPGKDFSRNGAQAFENCLRFLLSIGGSSLNRELYDCFFGTEKIPSASLFTQQRAKLAPNAFPFLFQEFNRKTASGSAEPYRLLACDGSDLNIFYDPEDSGSFFNGRKDVKGYNQLHLNALYDLNSRKYTDILIEKSRINSESKALVSMIKRMPAADKTIILADRGYETYNVLANIMEKGLFFVIRVKDINSRGGIAHGFHFPDKELDEDIELCITRNSAIVRKDPVKYRRITPGFDFDFLNTEKDGKQAVYPMRMRIVRFPLKTDKEKNSYECILTNLNREEFSAEKIKELYQMRWGIETSFRELKYSIGLSNLHSKKADYVEQEIYARVIMYNFCETITSHVIIKQKNTKYLYRVNFTMAVHICKIFLRKCSDINPPDVLEDIRRYMCAIRPNRKFPRQKKRKGFVSFLYRIS